MNQRLNITLPGQTVRMPEHAVSQGQRSRSIDEAVRRCIRERWRANLREWLELGAEARSERDRETAEHHSSCLIDPHDPTREGRHPWGELRRQTTNGMNSPFQATASSCRQFDSTGRTRYSRECA